MAQKKQTNTAKWFQLGLFGVLISAPNAAFIKYSLGSIDPFYFNALRFLLIAIILTPFILKNLRRLKHAVVLDSVKAGVCMAIAVICYVWAIKLSQASYVSVIVLLNPIILLLYSAKLFGEKISMRSVAGITLAAIGAMVIVLLPIALKQGEDFTFYPLATFFALLNCVFFPLAIIYYKRANESGLPMSALMGVSAWIIFAANTVFFIVMGNTEVITLDKAAVIGILYSGVFVALVGRTINVLSYEHIGAAASGVLTYLEVFLAILLPLIFLGEKLSKEMVLGGIIILLGVYVVESHKSTHHKHHYIFRSH